MVLDLRVLITGGAGFIGSHLCEKLLAAGCRVSILDDFNDYYDPAIKRRNILDMTDRVEVIEADIRDAVLLERCFAKGNFDAVVHLAARAGVRPSIANPKLYMTTNIEGTFNLLDACRYYGVKNFIFASSSSVYGVNTKVPFAETDPIERTISPYAATKIACEQICSNYSHLFGIRMRCLRFFTVYGPRQRPDLAIAAFTAAILDDRAITRFGGGQSLRDYTYIDDIVEGIMLSMQDDGGQYQVINLGGHATTSLSRLIERIEHFTGKKAKIIEAGEQAGDVPMTYADVNKAREILRWEPKVPLDTGLERYVSWVQEQRAR